MFFVMLKYMLYAVQYLFFPMFFIYLNQKDQRLKLSNTNIGLDSALDLVICSLDVFH